MFRLIFAIIFYFIFIDVAQGQAPLTTGQISSATELIKNFITDREITTIGITDHHNGRYTITSTLRSSEERIEIITHMIYMTGAQRDTTFALPQREFLVKLDKASYPVNSIRLAGHYQTISVKKNSILENTFDTRAAGALMTLLTYGE